MATFMHKEHETVRNDLADLAGSRFVCAVESSEGQRLAEALIKQVTGGVDLIKARFLFQEYFEFPPQFKVFLGTNHKPVVRDTDSAIWERLRLIPFTVQIPAEERDKTLHALLITELPGILAWAVRGCLDWQKQRGLAEPAEVLQATTTYRNEMDIVGRFIDDACYVTPQVRAKAGELYSAYKKWCEGQTEEKAVSMRAFSNRLDDLGYEKVANNGIWRVGITLRDVSQHAEE
jgi:putative DNA primase/helicase